MSNIYAICVCGEGIGWWSGSSQFVVCRHCGEAYFVPRDGGVQDMGLKFFDKDNKPLAAVPVRAQVAHLDSLGWDCDRIAAWVTPSQAAELAVWAALQLPER